MANHGMQPYSLFYHSGDAVVVLYYTPLIFSHPFYLSFAKSNGPFKILFSYKVQSDRKLCL